MPRDFSFHKDRMNMLAGLVEDDDFETTRQSLAEEYRKEMNEDVEEVSSTLQEYTAYMGYKPENSEGELEPDCECPEKAKPAPEESGLPGWSYYDADPTYSKLSTMKDDLQHKKELQWVAPLDSELEDGYEDMDEADATAAFKAKVSGMINEHSLIHGMLPNGIGFGDSVIEHGWGMKEQPDLPGELEDIEGIEDPNAGLPPEQHRHTRGDDSWMEHDAQGIPLTRVCDVCRDVKLSKYRPEILSGYGQEDVDEPIEPEDW